MASPATRTKEGYRDRAEAGENGKEAKEDLKHSLNRSTLLWLNPLIIDKQLSADRNGAGE